MKTTRCRAFIVLAALLAATPLYAADYSSMTTEELNQIRGTLREATQTERDAFRAEWLKRLDTMTPEQRAQYTGPGGGKGAGPRDGSGMGGGKGGGQGKGKK